MRELNEVYDNINSVKFLGLSIEPKLQWNKHINIVVTWLASDVFLLKNLDNKVSKYVLRTAYFATFYVNFYKSIIAWGHTTDARLVFSMPRMAVRVLGGLGFRYDSR